MLITPEVDVYLDKFQPRDYQKPVFDALRNKGYKKLMCIWPRRCLSGNTHILLANGSWKFLKDIEVGDKILSWNGSEFVPDTVKSKWSTGIKKTRELKSYGYIPIITSEDHKFASCWRDRGVPRYRKVSDLRSQVTVLNYAGIGHGNEHNPDLAEFIGYMIADGYCSGYQQPKFTNTNKDILDRVAFLANKLFGYTPIWRRKGNAYDLGFTNGTRGGGTFKNKVKELFRSSGQDVPKSQQRLMPIIWNLDEESLGRFFAAIVSADGSVYAHKSGFIGDRNRSIPPANEIIINCGKSYEYAWDMYWLLRKIGIVPQVPIFERKSNWKIKVSKRYGVKWLLSNGKIFGKEGKQASVLDKIPSDPFKPKVINGCFYCRQKNKDHGEEELFDIETEKHHNFIANGYIVHNSGKDLCAYNICIKELLTKVQTIYYVFPTYSSGRRILWDAIDNDGFRILDYLPKEVIESKNEQMMRIRLKNGSVFQIIGSDNYDNALVGTNPRGIVFSEFAISNPNAYSFVRPILSANDGWVLIVSTPRGKNFMWEMYQVALQSPNWFVSKLTVDDTQHIPLYEIEQERADGEMSEDLQLQEYWTSFDMGVEGAFYTKYMDKARLDGRISNILWEPDLKVHTAWDIGVRDSTAIIFFQIANNVIRIIDCYEKSKEGLEHYVNVLKSKDYTYGKHIGPHDIRNMEFSTGITRWEKAKRLGITFTVADKIGIMDGIEAVRSTLPRCWFDFTNAAPLIKALSNYRQEFDNKRKVYKERPLHDSFSHFSDAMRYLCVSLKKVKSGSSPEELERRYRETIYGAGSNTPRFFRDI